ncbi:hypothetical protein ABTH88_20345, partial [Acinetobacter baumannii]
MLDGLAAALLLVFGIDLLWESFKGPRKKGSRGPLPPPSASNWDRPLNLAGAKVGAWAFNTEGLESRSPGSG